jgi:hypothetical protein
MYVVNFDEVVFRPVNDEAGHLIAQEVLLVGAEAAAGWGLLTCDVVGFGVGFT